MSALWQLPREIKDKTPDLKVAGFIANRIAFNRSKGPGGQKSFSRFIIRLSTIATVISVMVMIIALSLANGFKQTVSQKVFSFIGHPNRFIQQGRPIQYNDSSYAREIMLSSYTAERMNIRLNDRVMIYFIKPNGQLRPDKLTVTGIYKTGIEEYDKTFAIADIQLIQRLNADSSELSDGSFRKQIGGYEIFLDDYRKIGKVAEDIAWMNSPSPGIP